MSFLNKFFASPKSPGVDPGKVVGPYTFHHEDRPVPGFFRRTFFKSVAGEGVDFSTILLDNHNTMDDIRAAYPKASFTEAKKPVGP
ncbi:MAG: hypothetical protein HYU57_08640 [Micavibrio aeruginosavorus]|nr:hypothetical protein [Micavibrio aeruginosavorus]